jgi:hypothetical protein
VRWRDVLGERMIEVLYSDLTGQARETLVRICRHIGVDAPGAWLDESVAMIGDERVNAGTALVLPPRMARRFNELQESYGFPGRAEEGVA